MKFSTFLRHLREGFKNVLRNGWMSFASVGSIIVSLFILGVFMLLALNVDKLATQIESQVEIRVYVQLGTEQARIDEINRTIGRIPEVKKVTFVSKEEGLERLRENLDDNAKTALQGYENENNPLPDGFDVEVFDPQNVAYVAKQIQAINDANADRPIMGVNYGQGTVEKLFRITNAVRNIGLVIVAGLAIMAMFLISTTIKMTILARRREIGIMKLVGATNNFIRWPFFVEGVLIGLGGAAITSAILMFGYSQLIDTAQYDMGLMLIKLAGVQEVGWFITGTLLILGTLLGIWGSVVSVRKYLKV
ncbi:permease-like cell division protein FtsX [Cohnella thailandensis]|uniref:Cell division protein FtsX n=1 Tax=Cohnella thailandensis TaxID=557557 RepID=A0A841SKW6_9BACL|nr:permease-like cell division protein FtsX [Cohnella thailandensis]MBB6632544.1 ABC transporter permease [Cohnella thailandensis]MBP1971838.1 cell division transport system permease protein [Cohnella thailandensis]